MGAIIRSLPEPGLSAKRRTHDVSIVEGILIRGKLRGQTRLLLDIRQSNGQVVFCHYAGRDAEHVLGTLFTLQFGDSMIVRGFYTAPNRLHCADISVCLSEGEIEQRQVQAAERVKQYELQQVRGGPV
jgi:hypothetical protein